MYVHTCIICQGSQIKHIIFHAGVACVCTGRLVSNWGNTADNSTVGPVFQALYYLENNSESDRVAGKKKKYRVIFTVHGNL